MQDESVHYGFVSKLGSIFFLVCAEDWVTMIIPNAGLKPGVSPETFPENQYMKARFR